METGNELLFGVQAKNVVSSTVFRWTPAQTSIFHAFAVSRGGTPSAAGDIAPLLRDLGLIKFAQLRTTHGELLGPIIERKVRWKLYQASKAVAGSSMPSCGSMTPGRASVGSVVGSPVVSPFFVHSPVPTQSSPTTRRLGISAAPGFVLIAVPASPRSPPAGPPAWRADNMARTASVGGRAVTPAAHHIKTTINEVKHKIAWYNDQIASLTDYVSRLEIDYHEAVGTGDGEDENRRQEDSSPTEARRGSALSTANHAGSSSSTIRRAGLTTKPESLSDELLPYFPDLFSGRPIHPWTSSPRAQAAAAAATTRSAPSQPATPGDSVSGDTGYTRSMQDPEWRRFVNAEPAQRSVAR